MSGFEIGVWSILFILVLVYIGMYVPVVLTLTSFVGAWFITDNFDVAINLLAIKSAETISSQEFGVIPLFVLMGLLVSVSDIARETFEVAHQIFRKIIGGLGIATVTANAIFAAITGISIASAAVFTRVAVPEMLRHGYNPRFAVGVVAGSSVLGMLIPPSILLIVYAFIVETSVGALFVAAIVPGLLLTISYCALIVSMGWFWPNYVGGSEASLRLGSNDDAKDDVLLKPLEIFKRLLPIFALVVIVIGGIYIGLFTPTEAGAVGALGALILALLKRQLSWKSFWKVSVETGHITASICFLIISASMYSSMLGMSGIPSEIEAWVQAAKFDFMALIIIYLLIVLLLGTILDSISIMLIVVPVFLPLLKVFDVDLIWFGVVTVISVEIGLLTPPLGIAVYVIKSTLRDPRITLADIFIGAAPFALIMLAVTVLVIAFPELSLFLVK
ncbi:MAG: TRAP transporter large permease [Rhodospirillales bacterium]|jgi:C4-dicarboxylate transporter DctM subunit